MARRGIRAVTLEEVSAAAEISVADLLEEFGSKEELAAAFLERRERDWTVGFVEAGARARGRDPTERLLAIFDVFHDWFQRDDYEACSFINVLLEMGKEHPLGIASREYLQHIREIVKTLAEEAGLERTEEFARSWHILMKGSIISAVEGDADAARRAQGMARDLIARHSPREIDWDFELALGSAPARPRDSDPDTFWGAWEY